MPVEQDADGTPKRITDPKVTAEEMRVLRGWIERAIAYDADLELATLCRDVLARPEHYPEHLPGYAERIQAELRRVEDAKRSGDARAAARFAGRAWQLAQEAASKALVDLGTKFSAHGGELGNLLANIYDETPQAKPREVFARIQELHDIGDSQADCIESIDSPGGEPRQNWALTLRGRTKPVLYTSVSKHWRRVQKTRGNAT